MERISKDDQAAINKYALKEINPDGIYVFSVLLCDNEVDRDFQRFSIAALFELSKLFLGKSGIFDHSMEAKGQTARIFALEVEEDSQKKTSSGENYHALKARAYMLKSKKNSDFIAELEAGIKKEVSVGCVVEKTICSVCGINKKQKSCSHRRGQKIGDSVVFEILDKPVDAYEWSFVVVPAQRNAGVTKKAKLLGVTYKKLISGGEDISQSERMELRELVLGLEEKAKIGQRFEDELRESLRKRLRFLHEGLSEATSKKMLDELCYEDLRGLEMAVLSKARVPAPQIVFLGEESAEAENKEYLI